MSSLVNIKRCEDAQTFEFPLVEGEIVGGIDGQGGMPTARQLEELYNQAQTDGYAAGHLTGYAEGKASAAAEIGQHAEVLNAIVGTLVGPLAQLDNALVDSVAELALLIARHLVRRELKAAPDEVVGVVREALKYLPIASRQTTIRLNPDDVELVRNALSIGDESTNWRLEADPLIARGGTIVETDTSRIDSSVENRLAAIASKMFGGERESDRDA